MKIPVSKATKRAIARSVRRSEIEEEEEEKSMNYSVDWDGPGERPEPDKAAEIWIQIEEDLSDRGCFNGIDDEVMAELRAEQIQIIRRALSG